jgi:N,N'-diacetyllegionaminate synthase
MAQIKIGNRSIKKNGPPFIIAEAGINHNGELEKAYSMIKLAKKSGADAIKFQTFRAEEFVGDSSLTYTYKSQGKEVTESMIEMFRRYEFTRDEWFLIKTKCVEEKIVFLSTPQNRSDLDLLIEIGIPAIKVGSDDFTNIPLLGSYAQTGLPMIVSCGMADLAEIYHALEAVGSLNGYPTILMLCTSQYPTPPEDVNLLRLKTLSSAFPMIILGFSDHTQGSLASSLAVAMGAVVFEKHFTSDHNLPGPDHWFSENPIGLKSWITAIRMSHAMIGNDIVRPTATERNMRILTRRSIVAISDIKKGDIFTNINIGLRRPGNGLPPTIFEKLIGLKAAKNIARNSLLKWGDFE